MFSELNDPARQPSVYASLRSLARSQARLEAGIESLLLFRRALASPTMCRFIPALSVPKLNQDRTELTLKESTSESRSDTVALGSLPSVLDSPVLDSPLDSLSWIPCPGFPVCPGFPWIPFHSFLTTNLQDITVSLRAPPCFPRLNAAGARSALEYRLLLWGENRFRKYVLSYW
jgi:hypothetical protein